MLKDNTGVKIKIGNRYKIYFVPAQGKTLLSFETLQPAPFSLQKAEQLISENKIDFISADELAELRNKRNQPKPDYELGNVFNESGWGTKRRKSIYR